ncbi:hypothetical protein [Streptomyces sp. YIM S03343]
MTIGLAACGTPSHEAANDSVPRARELVDIHERVLSYTADFRPGGPYTPPDRTERDRLSQAVGHLLEGDAAQAQRLLAPLGLGVTRLTDTGSGHRYDEIAATGPGRAAHWGRLYLNADSRTRWNVQVPHPVSDQDTEKLGLRLLEDSPGGSLVLAGAHRKAGQNGAADVAHREDSAFHTIVVTLQKYGVPGLQVHGFAESSGGPYDAVISGGAAQSASNAASALADRMEADGLRVCRGWSAHCPLEGTLNVQGRSATRQHSPFLHVELAPDARGDGNDADKAAGALGATLATWAAA